MYLSLYMEISIRKGILSELPQIKELFAGTITSICQIDYNTEQIEVWKSSINNVDRWNNLIINQYFIVAEIDKEIVGFASLDHGNYIDMLYVHKDFQRQGIAQRLYDHLEHKSKYLNIETLTADVSKTAKPFFERNGFTTIARQVQVRSAVEIVNYKMQKTF
ncbi:GNAT family N-acetyltransferase [Sphingobacterium ginsenosidimutans]|uniref:GNAT family N-acetyltransferase n=2 Tax=Sphingobacterium ginsenosidimutans TaxID=687845 RepID=A0ABP7ZXB9_9SPHI